MRDMEQWAIRRKPNKVGSSETIRNTPLSKE